jgi:uncharacterized membrane protein YeaQ/YmgE (transglycosylase-associated protein family)
MSRRTASRALAVLLATAPLVSGAFVGLLTIVFGLGLQCAESCTGEGWQHTAGAWQWSLYPILGAIVFLAGLMTFVFVCCRRPGGALFALVMGTLVTFSGMAWSGDNWLESLDRHPMIVAVIGAIIVLGVFATLLCAPTEEDAPA